MIDRAEAVLQAGARILAHYCRSVRSLREDNAISIDEWNQFACRPLIGMVRLSEFFSQQGLLEPDPV